MIFWFLYCSLCYQEKSKRIKGIWIILFVVSFSYNMGTDWTNYQPMYEKQYYNNVEIGYVLLNILGNKLGMNYEIFVGVTLFFCNFIMLKIISNYSENKYIYCFVLVTKYLIVASLEPTMRQLIAIVIISLGYKKIEEKKFLEYLLYVIIALLFHKSAIIGIIIYFFDKVNLNIKKTIILFVVFPFLIKFFSYIVQIVILFFPKYKRYEGYLKSSYYGQEVMRNSLLNIYIILTTLFFLFFIFYFYDRYKLKKNYMKNMAIIYILITFYMNKLPILYRVREYFVLGLAVILSHNIKGKKICSYISIMIIYITISLLFFVNFYYNPLNKQRYGEYKNYFVELIKGNIKEDFSEKLEEYNKKIKSLIKK